jgi:lipopolysaccharide biosynthesis glycosyltransferase
MENINICVCADGNYVSYVAALFESISRFHSGDVCFHLVTDRFPSGDLIANIMDAVGKNSFQYYELGMEEFSGYMECEHFTKAMYYRFKIPELLCDLEWALYLDCDILVRKNLWPMFDRLDSDLGIYACLNPFFTRKASLGIEGEYFNSGVMLLNCKYWRDNNVMEELLALLRDKEDNLAMPDQDVLNIYYDSVWGKLDPKFNAQTSMFMYPVRALKESSQFESALNDPVVVHFSSPNKQWHRSCSNKYVKEYCTLKYSLRGWRRGYLLDLLTLLKYKFRSIVQVLN